MGPGAPGSGKSFAMWPLRTILRTESAARDGGLLHFSAIGRRPAAHSRGALGPPSALCYVANSCGKTTCGESTAREGPGWRAPTDPRSPPPAMILSQLLLPASVSVEMKARDKRDAIVELVALLETSH